MPEAPIILFDGVCNLCDHAVRFVLARDRAEQFRFAALQSPAGRQLLDAVGASPDLDSVVLIADGKAHTRSDAALRIAARLSGLWPGLTLLLIVPRPIRNWAYDFVAKNRYRWFGTRAACMIPTPELRSRFLS